MSFLFLTILFPFLGFFLLSIIRNKCSESIAAAIGVGSVGMSALVTMCVIFDVWSNIGKNIATFVFVQDLWKWFFVNDFCVFVSLRLDGLSLIMLSMITGIGFIIHMYAIWYMSGSEGYSRFFAYTNLFMSNMNLLVLSDNLLLMYFGWEGVGLSSYLLIGFYYSNRKNGIAALKAFIMTRISDMFLMCALFMIYDQYHTLNFGELLSLKIALFDVDNCVMWISLMLFIGAIGKSAQLPFYTWLVSAMVGPTPVSALIHAATMVTAGVYLIVRMDSVFIIDPNILYLVGIVGALTLILSSILALLQTDVKKVLAYSTISQIGYMFMALGGSHWVVAMYHLIIHAFFKTLLFLAAGSLIYVCRYEQNIFRMGGLYNSVPFVYIAFLIGGASLSAFPIITSGFYSKEMILLQMFYDNNYFCWILGTIGAFITPLYIFRVIFLIFHGKRKINPYLYNNTIYQNIPLFVLSILSTFIGGWIQYPLSVCIVDNGTFFNSNHSIYLKIFSGTLVIGAVWLAFILWSNYSCCVILRKKIFSLMEFLFRRIQLFFYYGFGFDLMYKRVFVVPYLFIANKLFYYKFIDLCFTQVVLMFDWLGSVLILSENKRLNWNLIFVNIGVAIILLFIVLGYYFS